MDYEVKYFIFQNGSSKFQNPKLLKKSAQNPLVSTCIFSSPKMKSVKSIFSTYQKNNLSWIRPELKIELWWLNRRASSMWTYRKFPSLLDSRSLPCGNLLILLNALIDIDRWNSVWLFGSRSLSMEKLFVVPTPKLQTYLCSSMIDECGRIQLRGGKIKSMDVD